MSHFLQITQVTPIGIGIILTVIYSSARPHKIKFQYYFSNKLETEKSVSKEEVNQSEDISKERYESELDSTFAEFTSQVSNVLKTWISEDFNNKLAEIQETHDRDCIEVIEISDFLETWIKREFHREFNQIKQRYLDT